MFAAAAELSNPMILAGIIWTLALGFASGNYACSLVHRLPRGRGILTDKPYCGSCRTPLATKDLFPVVSALLLRHKCRYCGAPIPKSHFWTEILVGLLFVCSFLQYGFSEMFLLSALLGTLVVILASIEANEGYVELRVLVAIAVTGIVMRTFADHTLYEFIGGGWFGLAAGLILWHKQVKRVGHTYTFPVGAKLAAVGGICAGSEALLPFLAFYFGAAILMRIAKNERLCLAFGAALLMTMIIAGPF